MSIQQKGLLQPIIVRSKHMNFEVVAGNRRLLACKKLGWKKITCHIVDIDDKAAFEISLSENLQRKTLSPIEEAEAFKAYVTDFGYGGVSELASRIGKSPSYISKHIRLLDLHPTILDSITSSAINTSIAQELSYIKDKTKQPEIASMISDRRLSWREAKELLKNFGKESSLEDVYLEDQIRVGTTIDSIQRKRHGALNKSIIVLRIAANRVGTIIEGIEEDWLLKEILMQHKHSINTQIDTLIKEKRKLGYRIPSS